LLGSCSKAKLCSRPVQKSVGLKYNKQAFVTTASTRSLIAIDLEENVCLELMLVY
jgi:hypothetical protein